MKYILLPLIISISSFITAFAQEPPNNDYPHESTMMLTLGGPLGIASGVVSIEPKNKSRHLKFRVSIGALKGVYYNSDQDTPGSLFLATDFVYLTQPDRRGFDFSVGLGLTMFQLSEDAEQYDHSRWAGVFPRINAGYRFFIGNKVFIRASVGFPELNNFTVGWLM